MNDDLFDIPAYKLVRRNDPSTSYEAAESIDPTKMQKIVLEGIMMKFWSGPHSHASMMRYGNGCSVTIRTST